MMKLSVWPRGPILVVMLSCLANAATADEGFWPFDTIPSAKIESRLRVNLTPQWIAYARSSILSMPGSCSAGFVSPRGLVITNHHCVRSCLERSSMGERNYLDNAFVAAARTPELPCREIELDQLLEITDVTTDISAALVGTTGDVRDRAREQAIAAVESRCDSNAQIHCDIATLYQGAQYKMHKYRRYRDVRLIFAPEASVSYFGGDPLNFTFPRYSFDVAFLRVYENGRPLDSTRNYFRWSKAGAADGEPTLVVGRPGYTRRHMTVSQTEFDRDIRLVRNLLGETEFRAVLEAFRGRGGEQQKMADPVLYRLENSTKADKYRHRALSDPVLIRQLVRREADLRARVDRDPELSRTSARAWDEIDIALQRYRAFYDRYQLLEDSAPEYLSTLLRMTRDLVRWTAELSKPRSQRVGEYPDSYAPVVKRRLAVTKQIPSDFEVAILTFYLEKLRDEFSADDAFMRQAFGTRTPAELAAFLVSRTKLSDPGARVALFDGGWAAVSASTDPLVVFVRDVLDPPAREVRLRYQREVEAVLNRNAELVAQAQFQLAGPDDYPDAANTPRLSFGKVAGLRYDTANVRPLTTIAGAFERATGRAPFNLPRTWLAAKNRIALDTPLAFITNNDVTGGSSGSPVLNGIGEIVGVVFDQNLPAIGGMYAYDEASHRAISVHSSAILEILGKVYGAQRLVDELRGVQ